MLNSCLAEDDSTCDLRAHFYPKFTIHNAVEDEHNIVAEGVLPQRVPNSWRMSWIQKYQSRLKTTLTPNSYPFDIQMLDITVKVREVDGTNLTYWFQPLAGHVVPQLMHPYRWRRDQGHASLDAYKQPDFVVWGLCGAREKAVGDCYTVTVVVKRECLSVFKNIVIAMMITSLIGSFTFFMDAYTDQILTLVVALLAVVTFQQDLNGNVLPRSPELSAIEKSVLVVSG